MQSMTNVLDYYVKALKQSGEFADVKFLFAGNFDYAQCPVTTQIIACGTGAQRVGQQKKSGELVFTVYGKNGASQRELLVFTEKILRVLCSTESGFETEKLTLSEPVFEDNLRVWTQQLVMGVYTYDTEAAGFEFSLCGKVLGVVDYSETSECDHYPVKEFLGGLVRFEKGETQSQLVLTLDRQTEFPTEGFTLCENISGALYSGCMVRKKQTKYQGKAVLHSYTIGFSCKTYKEG